jgi:predicted TIM-barrel fold metal-dependent hydrolase
MGGNALIVDTHVHVVSPDEQRYPLDPPGIGTEWFRDAPVSVEDYRALMRDANVDCAVLVQAFTAYGYDNRYVVSAAESDRSRFASVCIVDPEAEPGPALHRLVTQRGASGARLFAIGNHALDSPASDAVMVVANDLGVRVIIALLPPQLPELQRLLARFPEIPVALDHCGFPDLRDGPPYAAATPLFDLASCANLHLKVTSNLLERAPDPRALVDRLAATFGAERLLWGSDFPQTHDRPYRELVALGRDACAHLTEAEQTHVLGLNALRLWPELAPA